MTSFILSFNLPSARHEAFPMLRLDEAKDGNSEHCTCQKIVCMQLGAGILPDAFTIRIVCRAMHELRNAFRAYSEFMEGFPSNMPTEFAQKKLVFAWTEACQCSEDDGMTETQAKALPRHEPPKNKISYNEDPALDFALVDYAGKRSQTPISTPPSPDVSVQGGPSSASMNGIFRLSPPALKLNMWTRLRTQHHINNKIQKAITERLTKPQKGRSTDNEFCTGYVYAMTDSMRPGFVKIGYSKDKPQIREKKLGECFKNIRLVSHTILAIPHARRVEKLVHAELLYLSRWIDCSECAKEHKEWFEMSVDLAKQVIRRWAAWMASNPYNESGSLKSVWQTRVRTEKIKNLKPAVDCCYDHTWQAWADTHGGEGTGNHSSRVDMIDVKENDSPWKCR